MRGRFIWRALRARLKDQAAELRAARRALRGGGVAVDVGANKGSYLYWLARWADEAVAFEPQPKLAETLRRVTQAVGLDNVVVEDCGVSDRSGVARLFLPSEGSPEASLVSHTTARSIPVPVTTLDAYFAAHRRVSLIKIDVEGAEQAVMRGAERLLADQRPVLLFESEGRHLDGGDVRDGFALLHRLGYQGWFFHGRALRPVAEFDPAVHQRTDGERFWRRPDYVNNFLFRPGQV